MSGPERLRSLVVLVVVVAPAGVASSAAEPDARAAFTMAVELVRGGDPDMRTVALERLRDGLPGAAFTVELAETLLPSLPADGQVRLLSTLAGRGDAAALAGVVKAASSADPAVVAAAIRAIATLGGGAQVPMLVGRLGDAGPVRDAVRAGLVAIQGSDVSPQLVAAAGDATVPSASRGEILEILAERRDREAIPLFVAVAKGDAPDLRAAAMRALAKVGGPAEVPGMVVGYLTAPPGRERDDAERAILAVCAPGPDAQAAAAAVLAAYGRAPDPATRDAMLPLVARIGGPEALAIVDGLVADADPARRKLGLVALSRWPDAAVTDRLLGLLAKTTDEAERRLLVGTLIRIAPIPNNGLTDAQRLALLADTMKFCTRDDDRRRVLERASAIRTVETLRFLVPFLEQPSLAESGAKGVVELAHHQKLRDGNKPEFTAALDRVLAVAKDPVTLDRAQRYKEGKTWERR